MRRLSFISEEGIKWEFISLPLVIIGATYSLQWLMIIFSNPTHNPTSLLLNNDQHLLRAYNGLASLHTSSHRIHPEEDIIITISLIVQTRATLLDLNSHLSNSKLTYFQTSIPTPLLSTMLW